MHTVRFSRINKEKITIFQGGGQAKILGARIFVWRRRCLAEIKACVRVYTLSASVKVDEVNRHIAKASAAFGALHINVFNFVILTFKIVISSRFFTHLGPGLSTLAMSNR